MQAGTAQDLSRFEELLASSLPFGDSAYLHDCTWQRYEDRLEMLREHIESSERLLSGLREATPERRYRVIGDPVLRDAVNGALGHYKLGIPHLNPEHFDNVMAHALPLLAEGVSGTPVTSAFLVNRRLGSAPYHGWLYSKESRRTTFSAGFTSLWDRVTHFEAKEPTEQEHRTLMDAARLLDVLLPHLSRSALAHTQMVVLVDPPSKGFPSVTFPDIMGTLVLAPAALQSTWSAAEFLLHEAMHVKFVDLEHTHSLVRTGYRASNSPVVHPLWHRREPDGSRSWHVKRCLTVMHVYSTLALFFSMVQRRASELEETFGLLGDLDPAKQARRAFDRAHFLGHALGGFEEELGLAGRRFVAWLTELVKAFDPSPPPPGAEVHLMLDLYERETEELHGELSTTTATPSVIGLVEELTTSELTKACEVLALLGDAAKVEREWPETATVAEQFWGVRSSVLGALRRVPVDAYGSTGEGQNTPAELVRQMIDESGDQVRCLKAELSSSSAARPA